MNNRTIFEDQVQCQTCGMIKNRTYMPGLDGLDIETLEREDNTIKCCECPMYEWVSIEVTQEI